VFQLLCLIFPYFADKTPFLLPAIEIEIEIEIEINDKVSETPMIHQPSAISQICPREVHAVRGQSQCGCCYTSCWCFCDFVHIGWLFTPEGCAEPVVDAVGIVLL